MKVMMLKTACCSGSEGNIQGWMNGALIDDVGIEMSPDVTWPEELWEPFNGVI